MNICIIGSGKIATNLGHALKQKKNKINRICSRNKRTGLELAKKLNSDFTKNIIVPKKTDLVIICVPDDNINEIAKKITNNSIIHTSGTTKISILKDCSNNYGVVWPIQTFSTKKIIDFKNIPICIEASNNKFSDLLEKIFKQLSHSVFFLNHKKRKTIHLSAVFSSNFLNHLCYISYKLLKEQKIPFSIMNPIIIETAKKIINNNIETNQTGPAIRKDYQTIEKHLKILSTKEKKKYLDIYNSITKSIISTYDSKL